MPPGMGGGCAVAPSVAETRQVGEPIDGAAGTPGQTGYLVQVDAAGTNVGYDISGWGKTANIINLTSGS